MTRSCLATSASIASSFVTSREIAEAFLQSAISCWAVSTLRQAISTNFLAFTGSSQTEHHIILTDCYINTVLIEEIKSRFGDEAGSEKKNGRHACVVQDVLV